MFQILSGCVLHDAVVAETLEHVAEGQITVSKECLISPLLQYVGLCSWVVKRAHQIDNHQKNDQNAYLFERSLMHSCCFFVVVCHLSRIPRFHASKKSTYIALQVALSHQVICIVDLILEMQFVINAVCKSSNESHISLSVKCSS